MTWRARRCLRLALHTANTLLSFPGNATYSLLPSVAPGWIRILEDTAAGTQRLTAVPRNAA